MYLTKPVVIILAKRVVVYLSIPVVRRLFSNLSCIKFFRLSKIVVVYLAKNPKICVDIFMYEYIST